MITESVLQIRDCLGQQGSLYQQLIETAKAQTEAIVQRNLESLRKNTGLQQQISMELGRLEKTRMELVKGLSSHFSISPLELTVSRLAGLVGGEAGQQLEETAGKLVGLANELAEVNQENQELLKMSLEFIDFSLTILTGVGQQDPRYDRQGGEVERGVKPPSKVFDFKV